MAVAVATNVLVVASTPPVVYHTRGTVKSIGPSEWVIERERGLERFAALGGVSVLDVRESQVEQSA